MSGASGEYLVLSRGKWDADASAEEIQHAIDAFYARRDRLTALPRVPRTL